MIRQDRRTGSWSEIMLQRCMQDIFWFLEGSADGFDLKNE